MKEPKPLLRIVLKQELIDLTGGWAHAGILNQFIFWSQQWNIKDKIIEEELKRRKAIQHPEAAAYEQIIPSEGWIYKSLKEITEEIKLSVDQKTTGRYLEHLINNGWILERPNIINSWDKTKEYRVDLLKISKDLKKLGYHLDGYPMLDTEPPSPNGINCTVEGAKCRIDTPVCPIEEMKLPDDYIDNKIYNINNILPTARAREESPKDKKEELIQAYTLSPTGKKLVVTKDMILTPTLRSVAIKNCVNPENIDTLWEKFRKVQLRDRLYAESIDENALTRTLWPDFCKDGYSAWARKDTPGREIKQTSPQIEVPAPLDDGSIESRIKKVFYDEFGPKDFGSWLQNLKFIDIKDDKLVLKTGDKFKKESIDRRYKEKIVELLGKMGFPELKTIEIIY